MSSEKQALQKEIESPALVLVNPKNGIEFGLNETARLIYDHLGSGGDYRSLLERLGNIYAIEDDRELLLDLKHFVSQLVDLGFLAEQRRFHLIEEIFLAITDRCNFTCRYCNTSSRSSGKELDPVQMLNIISKIKVLPLRSIRISGGEPFLHGQLSKILAMIDELAIPIAINTNASLIDQKTIADLGSVLHLSELLIGIDSFERKDPPLKYTTAKLIKTLHSLKTELPRITLNFFTVVTALNAEELGEIAALAAETGIESCQFEPFLPVGHGLSAASELEPNKDQRKKIFKTVRSLKDRYGSLIGGNYLSMGNYFEEMGSLLPDQRRSGAGCFRQCSAATTKIAIKPNGDIVPCDRLWDYSIGNIFTDDPIDLLNDNPRLATLRSRGSTTMASRDSICQTCSYVAVCGGGCPAVPFYTKGDLLKPDHQSCIQRYFEECGDAFA